MIQQRQSSFNKKIHCIMAKLKVIPQKLNLPMNFFEIFPERSLLSTVSKKNNKNDRSLFSLKRYDGPTLPHLCLC